jgi:hypothetical protein
MGDDRPTVYQEDGKWVFRASGVWRCDRELWAHMNGVQPEATPDWLQEKFDQGNEGEDKIMDYAEHVLEVPVYGRQDEGELKVGKSAVIRFHPDGRTDTVLVEAKTMAEKTYMTTWLRSGLKGFPGYSAQVAVMAEALGVNSVLMAIGIKDDAGKVKEVKTFSYDVGKLPVTVKDVKKKIMRVMRYDEMPKCSVDQFPCPFVFLHDEKEIMVSTDEMLELYAQEIHDCRDRKKRAEDELKNWQGLMTKQLDTHDLKGQKVTAGKWEITDVFFVKKNVGLLDYGRMKEDGVDVESYRGEPKTAETRYQTVKEVKDHA